MSRSPSDIVPSVKSQGVDTSDPRHVIGDGAGRKSELISKADAEHISEQSDHQSTSKSKVGPLSLVSSPLIALRQGLNPQQHRDLLTLSLLEERCTPLAVNQLNNDRRGNEKVAENDPEVKAVAAQFYSILSKHFISSTGLPEELASDEAAPIRKSVLFDVDEILRNVPRDLVTSSSPSSAKGKRTTFTGFGSSQGKGPLSMVDRGGFPQAQHFGDSLSPPKQISAYINDYQEIGLLGKGGYGHVFKVRNHLDNQEYAIKKVLITSKRLKRSRRKEQIDALLAELRTLAKLNHTNVVRYYHGWIEKCAQTVPHSEQAEPHGNFKMILSAETGETSTSYNSTDNGSRVERPGVTAEHGGNESTLASFNGDQDQQIYDDNVVFGYSSAHISQEVEASTRSRRASNVTITSTSGLQASMLSVGENEDSEVETIPRIPIDEELPVLSKVRNSVVHFPTGDSNQPDYFGSDIILHIKMSLHPMTLSKYLSWQEPEADETLLFKHCFHREISGGLLAAILDGIEYLHSQKIVHRDLKPANILLSITEDRAPALSGCVDIMSCPDCAYDGAAKRIYLTPCIGDFGLMAELKESSTSPMTDPAGHDNFQPSPLAALYHKPVGTPYYRPAAMPKEEPVICPKLDVYSLGVIALEMVYRFETRSERAAVLTNLKKGILPPGFEDHPMAPGIRAMSCEDRAQRWDCAAVRRWLQGLEGKGKGRAVE